MEHHLSLETKELFDESCFANHRNHINGIEYFERQSKRILGKYNGINKKYFHLFSKECEFRFKYGMPSDKLKILRK